MKSLVFLLLFISGNLKSQTVILERINDDGSITIAADSKMKNYYPDGRIVTYSGCKIGVNKARKCGFANAGFYMQENAQECKKAIANNSKLKDVIAAYENSFKKIIFNYLESEKQILYERNLNLIKTHKYIMVQTLFAKYENNVPNIAIVSFYVTSYRLDKPTTIKFHDETYSTRKSYCIAGAIEHIADNFNNPDYWTNGTANAMRVLIKTAIKYDSESVGEPIDIVQITNKSYKWIENHNCQP